MIDQLNGINQKDTESNTYRVLAAPPPLPMIPLLPPIERTYEAPADASVVAARTNANIDTIDEEPEEEE